MPSYSKRVINVSPPAAALDPRLVQLLLVLVVVENIIIILQLVFLYRKNRPKAKQMKETRVITM